MLYQITYGEPYSHVLSPSDLRDAVFQEKSLTTLEKADNIHFGAA
jgi:hypothetical protein